MSALSQFDARNAEVIDFLNALSTLDWATKYGAAFVMSAEIGEDDRDRFQRALRSRSTSRTAVFNGLFVVASTNFELFIKDNVNEVLSRKAKTAGAFQKLNKTFQDNYVSEVGRLIAGKASGVVGGVPYSRFDDVALSFAKGYVGNNPFRLVGDVFTIGMGNPTWERLEKLFWKLGVPDPLGKELASTASMKTHFGNAKWTEVLDKAKAFHEDLIRRRNRIVHTVIPLSVVEDEVRAAVGFLNAFASGLDQVGLAHI